jgi:hypothetical protein
MFAAGTHVHDTGPACRREKLLLVYGICVGLVSVVDRIRRQESVSGHILESLYHMTSYSGNMRSHSCAIAFCLMSAFQSLLVVSTMATVVYMVFTLEVRVRRECERAQYHSAPSDDHHATLLTIATFIEAAALLITLITGLFGMRSCCLGIGRILAHYENSVHTVVSEYAPHTPTPARFRNSHQPQLPWSWPISHSPATNMRCRLRN